MTGPLTRILLRYGAGALVAWGVLSPDLGGALAVDPDVLALAGIAVGFAVEGYYWLAKRQGWAT